MKVTVCELPGNWTESDIYWNRLIHHLEEKTSDLLVLPEMPFFEWITKSGRVDPDLWKQAVKAHDKYYLPKAAAIVSGAFCLSSNYNGPNTGKEDFGGTGWIIEPERGDVLGTTSLARNFLTLDIDMLDAENAKKSYPRYVKE